MGTRSATLKVSRASFGCALMTVVGPALHYSTNAGSGDADVATEAGVFGLVLGLLAIGLAAIALRRFRTADDQIGRGYAVAALRIGGVGAVIWTATLLIRVASA
jgi:uncharacterized membrane protein YidH (DUF202 family)